MSFNESKYNKRWENHKISEFGTFARGISKHRPRGDDILFEDGKYPLVQTSDIKNANLYVLHHTQEYGEYGLSQSKLRDKGTLCITIAANIAESAIISYPMCFPDSIVGFKADKDKTSEEFVYYIFECMKQAIQRASTGSTQDNTNLDFLNEIEFCFPEKNEQEKIEKVLVSIDKKILNNTFICSELESLAKLIYNYWFIQFDFPDENGNPYKSNGGKMVWNNELKREIPEGWKVKTLGDIIVENKKSPLKVSDISNNGEYPFFTSGEGTLLHNKSLVDGLNCYMNTGGNGDVKVYNGKAAYSTDTWCIKGKDNSTAYLGQILLSFKPRLDIKFFAGTGLQHLQKDLLKMENIIFPPQNILEKFNKEIEILTLKISNYQLQNRDLIELRNFLLPMLMSGQVTVK